MAMLNNQMVSKTHVPEVFIGDFEIHGGFYLGPTVQLSPEHLADRLLPADPP